MESMAFSGKAIIGAVDEQSYADLLYWQPLSKWTLLLSIYSVGRKQL